MERGWLETIQLLGLDVALVVVVVLLALVPVARLIVRLADGVGQDRVPPRSRSGGPASPRWSRRPIRGRRRSGTPATDRTGIMSGLEPEAARMPDPLLELRDSLRAFATERDWDQFHSPAT